LILRKEYYFASEPTTKPVFLLPETVKMAGPGARTADALVMLIHSVGAGSS